MDYEKKYKEALERAKSFAKRWGGIQATDSELALKEVKAIFPELKESEDEKIIYDAIKEVCNVEDARAFAKHNETVFNVAKRVLEKQGDHDNFRNKIQIGDKVTRNKDGVIVNLSQLSRVAKKDEKQGKQKPVKPQQDMLSQEKYAKAVDECVYGEQKSAWSEEDETVLGNLIYALTNDRIGNNRDEYVDWLKSIRPQKLSNMERNGKNWKPSDEQIEALESATENCAYSEYQDCLRELIGQLKKLKRIKL